MLLGTDAFGAFVKLNVTLSHQSGYCFRRKLKLPEICIRYTCTNQAYPLKLTPPSPGHPPTSFTVLKYIYIYIKYCICIAIRHKNVPALQVSHLWCPAGPQAIGAIVLNSQSQPN